MDKVLSSRILRAGKDGGCEIALRLPWYRALPLSVIEIVDLKIDARPIPRDGMRLIVDGKAFPLDDLRNQTEVVWYMLDDAFLHIPDFTPETGKSYRIDVAISWNPPYAKGWWPVSRCSDTLDAA